MKGKRFVPVDGCDIRLLAIELAEDLEYLVFGAGSDWVHTVAYAYAEILAEADRANWLKEASNDT